MSYLDSIDPFELATLGNIIAITLSENRTADELNSLGNFIVSIGSLILTIAAQEQNLKSIQNK